MVPNDRDRGRCHGPARGADHHAHPAPQPRRAQTKGYRHPVPGRAVQPALAQCRRRFPHAGRRDLAPGLYQPEHRASARSDARTGAAGRPYSRGAARKGLPRPRHELPRGTSARRAARMGHGLYPSADRRAPLVPYRRHGHRGGRPDQVHPRAVRPHGRPGGQSGAFGCGRSRPVRQPRKERIPDQYVARHPHPDERHHRLHHPRGQQHQRHRTGPGLSDQDPRLEPPSALAHQRHPGHEPHRERQAPSRGERGQPVRCAARHQDHHQRTGARQAARAVHGRDRRRGRGRLLRPDAPRADPAQPAVQRHQVHPGGRHGLGPRPPKPRYAARLRAV